MTKRYLVLDESMEREREQKSFIKREMKRKENGRGGRGLGYILGYSANMGKSEDLS
jgi:hypothetical protein